MTNASTNNRPNPRYCKEYDPAQDFIQLPPYREGGPASMWLEVKFRVFWFQQYCKENNIRGYIDDSDVSYCPEVNCARAVCTVYMDDMVVGKSAAYVPMDRDYAFQTAGTSAKGRALANAGFGTLNSSTVSEDGAFDPCDAGIPIPNGQRMPENAPRQGEQVRANAAANASKVAPNVANNQPNRSKSAPTAPSPTSATNTARNANTQKPANNTANSKQNRNENVAIPTTREEALQLICPIGDKTKGLPMAVIAATQPNMIKFYASDRYKPEPRLMYLKEAAKLILGGMAS